ncbi:ABC transporter permease [Paenibacillus lemnae]|uniref:ABC transporter permease n=1 Tax=Paenibacillus lemnae TaxID=1330551 RepID=A0A848M4E2_PAELE|nr:ABC transporter permease [Paenibacillus lemnae]NMO95090.1 ABC transporter permease [Paenibacillus lemnae]
MNKWMKMLSPLVQPAAAVLVGLLVGAVAIVIAGGEVLETYKEMWNGAFGGFYFLTNTLSRATPIILVGLGAAFAFRAGFFNLGAPGQMIFGALAASLVGLYMPGPGWLVSIAALLAGVIAGGLWSVMAGYFDARFAVNLLISTLLLNYIADLLAGYLVAYPLKDTSGSAAMAQSAMLDKSVWLPKLFSGMPLHIGFVFAVVLAVIIYVLLKRSVIGYEVRMLGGNPLFALYGGINRGTMMLGAMFFSGGLAGLGGAVEILGSQYRYIDGALTTADYAWTGIMAALLARSHPLGTLAAALFLAALQTGGQGVERNTEVPLEVGAIIQAALILFISARFTYDFLKRRKGSKSHGTAV